MTSRILALISDIDGTLVTPDKVLTPRTQDAVHKLYAAGIAFAITSGRPPRGMEMFIAPLALQAPIAGFNGGVFVKPDMAVIEEHVLAVDVAKRAVDLILEHGLDAWVYHRDEWFVRNIDAPHVEREQRTIQFAPTVVRDFGAFLDQVIKVVGVSDKPDRVTRCQKEAQTVLGERASAACSQSYYLDITHPSANKGMVVTTLSKLLLIPCEQIATIGDGQNDIGMFQKCGLSIAMGNATLDVQKQARFITASNQDEGFAEAVERYLLGEEWRS